MMLGARTLLVNPPLVAGVAFTRQGRCQEREEVLGTTKPPLTLALLAALLRDSGASVRLVNLTATRRTVDTLIAQLRTEGFAPTLILFPSTTPTFDADVAAIAPLKTAFGAPMFSFGPHASCTPQAALERAPALDGVFVGEPEDAAVALAMLEPGDDRSAIPSLAFRRGDAIVAHRAHGTFAGFLTAPRPAWELLELSAYSLPLVGEKYVLVETSRGCPYACDFCVAPIHQGHKFRERSAPALADEIEWAYRDVRRNVLLPLGRHGHPQREDVRRVLRRAHRPEVTHSLVRQCARRQSHRPRVRRAVAPVGLLDARARDRDRIGRHA